MYQKELYDQRVHGQPLVVDLFARGKLNGPPWKGPYTVMKKISDVTYRVQNLQRWKDRQDVHFNRLKPCPKDIHLERPNQLVTQPSYCRNRAPSTQPLPSDIELVEEDNEVSSTMGLGDTDSNPHPTLQTVWWNPPRGKHPPQHYGDIVYN